PPPGVTRHRASVEPGLSSPHPAMKSGHPAVWHGIIWDRGFARSNRRRRIARPFSYQRDEAPRGGRSFGPAIGEIERRDEPRALVERPVDDAVDPQTPHRL